MQNERECQEGEPDLGAQVESVDVPAAGGGHTALKVHSEVV